MLSGRFLYNMRKLGYIGGLAGVLVFVFLMVGVFKKSILLEQDITINRSVKKVYYSMLNPMKMKEWLVGFERIEALDGFLHGPGSRFLVTLSFGGREFKVLQEVTVFEWKRELGLKMTFPHISVKTNIVFEQTADGTKLDIKHDINGDNLFWKSFIPFVKPWLQDHFDQSFINLKEVLEQPLTDST